MHQQGIRMEGMSDLNALNLESGEVVGGYTLISRLGSGAMGSVWRVRDDGGTTYAMKILRDSLTDESVAGSGSASTALHDPDLKPDVTPRERLRREAMALKKINHPGVCGIVDMELDDTLAFIVTELIEGKNLKDDVAANGRYVGDDLERPSRKLIEATKAVHGGRARPSRHQTHQCDGVGRRTGIGRFRYRDGRGRKSRDPHRPSDGYTRIHRTRDY